MSLDAYRLMVEEVDRLYEEHDRLPDNLDRDNVHLGAARWERRNGVCKYNTRLTEHQFGKRMSSQPKALGHHAIVVNERILESGDREGFIDTVRHELAHALAYEIYGSSQKHNHNWKLLASTLGATPVSCNHKKENDYKYFIYCPVCGTEGGKIRRSKVIKRPFTRKCGNCGNTPMSSYEAGQDPPEEGGVVKVESIPWSNLEEWRQQGAP